MSTILDEIVENKKKQIEAEKQNVPLSELKTRARSQPVRFREALAGEKISLIAEIKPQAPSAGELTNLPAVRIARVYEEEDAVSAVSCLTDKEYFGQGLDTLRTIKTVLRKPVLRKDFILDPYQVYQSRVWGADAILLIASILKPSQLQELHGLTQELGMDALVEIHGRDEWKKLSFQPRITGINNRTLDGDFQTDLSVTENLAPEITNKTLLVSESGIKESADVKRLRKISNLNAILVGSSLLENAQSADQVRSRVRDLMS